MNENLTVSTDVVVRKARNGMGVFANRSFSDDEKIFEVKGTLVTGDIDEDLSDRVRDNLIRYDEDRYISPEGELGVYINHSCLPNSAIRKEGNKLILVSISPISSGEEIVMDYSAITGDDDIWELVCNCGEKNCRGIIKNFGSLPKMLRKDYIARKIVPGYVWEL